MDLRFFLPSTIVLQIFELDPSDISVDAVLQHIASGKTLDPNGYSTDESGNLLVYNESESYDRVLDDMELTAVTADGLGLEVIDGPSIFHTKQG